MSSSKPNLIKNTLVLSLIGILFQVIGVFFMIRVAQIFGANSKVDAYYYVLGIYFFLIQILQNVLKTILMPIVLSEQKNNSDNILDFYNGLISYSILFLTLISACFCVIILSDALQYIVPKSSSLVFYRQFFLFGLPLLFLNILYGIFSIIYNSYQRFGILEFLLNSRIVFVFIFMILLHRKLDTFSLIIGNLVGQIVVVVSAFYFLNREGILKFKFNFRLTPSLKYLFKFSVIPLIAGLFNASQPLVSNYYLANYSSEGAITLLAYLQKISSIPTLLFTAGFMTVFLSHISKLEVYSDIIEIRKSVTSSLSSLNTIVLPLILYLYIIREELFSLFFQNSKLTFGDLQIMKSSLLFFLISFYFLQIYSLLFRILIAKKLLRNVLFINILSSIIHLVLTIVLVKHFSFDLLGIIISMLSSNVAIVLFSFLYIHYRFHIFHFRYLLMNFFKTTFSLILTFFVMNYLYARMFYSYDKSVIFNLFLFSFLFFTLNYLLQIIAKNKDILALNSRFLQFVKSVNN